MIRKALLSVMLICAVNVGAETFNYRFDSIRLADALSKIADDHPDIDINFIYDDLDNYMVTAQIHTDDIHTALRQVASLHPVTIVRKNKRFYIEALQHGRYVYTGRATGTDNEPVAAATVLLLNREDSTVVTYCITDMSGCFSIPCDRRDVVFKMTAMGYKPVIFTPQSFSVGDVIMELSPIMLNATEIKINRPAIHIKGSSIIVGIQGTPLEDMPTADDILRRLPSVSAASGTYSVLGRGKAIIYINGRKILNAGDISRLLPKDIKDIEIIRNPGAEYDAEAAAIINIRLRRRVLQGLGTDAMSYGSFGRSFSDSEQLSLTYGSGALYMFANVSNYSSRLDSDRKNMESVFTDSYDWRLLTDMSGWKSEYYDFSVSGGLTADVAETGTLGAKAVYADNTRRNGGPKYDMMWRDGELYETLESVTRNPQGYSQWLGNIFYNLSVNDKLKIELNGDCANMTSHAEHESTESGTLTPAHTVLDATTSSYDLLSGNLKLKWHPDGMFKFTFGADGSLLSQNRTSSNSERETQSQLYSKESKYAFFARGGYTAGKWDIGLGLRFETSVTDYREGNNGPCLLYKTYRRLYPDVSVTGNIGNTSMSAGFNSRIKRPTFYQLRNGCEYFNRYETTEGNPLLLPTYTYGVYYTFQYSGLTTDINYSIIKNYITEQSIIQSDNPLKLLSRPVNMPQYTALQFNLSYNRKVGLWHPYLSAGLTKTFYNIRVADNMPRRSSLPYMDFKITNYLAFAGNTVYVDLYYNPPGNYCESRNASFFKIDAGLYRRFLNNSLYVSLQATNITGQKSKDRVYYDCSILDNTSFRDDRTVCVVVRYSFRHTGKYRGEPSAQDEIDRMK